MLDPFAGAGSLPLLPRRAGWRTLALDRDRSLRFGLAEVADRSIVGDARRLPLRPRSIDAVAAEPPYREDMLLTVRKAMGEAARVLRPGGRLVLLVASSQADALHRAGAEVGLEVDLDVAIDRKGTAVRCLRMQAPGL